jgi:alkylhydroperoxidase family enzyme
MARISLRPPRTLSYRLAGWFSRHRYRAMLDPVAAMGRNVPAGRSCGIFETQADRPRQLDHWLKDLAVMAAAGKIACSQCMDFGFWAAAAQEQMPPVTIRAVPGWWDSDLFTELERLVLGYAEAMTATPPTVTDELVAQLREHLSEGQLVELTAIVAMENLRSRINAALGPRGFQETRGFQVARRFQDGRQIQAARP